MDYYPGRPRCEHCFWYEQGSPGGYCNVEPPVMVPSRSDDPDEAWCRVFPRTEEESYCARFLSVDDGKERWPHDLS